MKITLFEGPTTLEVVGESWRQDNLWRIVGGRTDQYVRYPVVAILVQEDNEYDPNAIAVYIDGLMVGYLSRETAKAYRPGLGRLIAERQTPIALEGTICGGGHRNDGIGNLGV